MSAELIDQLRHWGLDGAAMSQIRKQAADRIEQLQRENAELREALEVAAMRFSYLAANDDSMRNGVIPSVGADECRAALANKGEK